MEPELARIAQLYATASRLFPRALDGVADAHLRERPVDGGNPMHWIAGHATGVRARLAARIGAGLPPAWTPVFARGGTNDNEPEWPPIETILAAWSEVSQSLANRFERMTADELRAPAAPSPGLDDTLLGAIGLVAFHDAYHIGQLGHLRARYGYARLVG